MVVKIVHDELVAILGGEASELQPRRAAGRDPDGRPAGLGQDHDQRQARPAGCGMREHKKVLLASLDTQRPAAQMQLEVLARQCEVASLPIVAGEQALAIARRALETARREGYDVLILDTAGRLSIDDALMTELAQVRDLAQPHETLLVADALTGQDAVNTARIFHERIGVTGIVLTRMDGDARGGAALSMRHVTGQPIKLVGMGEKLDALEPFHPDRVAARILDMGDVVSLVEQAAEMVDKEDAEKLARKMAKGSFDLDDLRAQLLQMRKMGGMKGILGKLPGVQKMQKQLDRGQHRREDDRPPVRDHRFDDAQGAAQRRPAQRLAQAAHRRRLRHLGPGRQPPAEAAPADAGHDEADEEGRRHPESFRPRRLAARPAAALSRRARNRQATTTGATVMAVRIRLARGGAKKRPYYRIVAADARSPRDGRFLERLGSYNPLLTGEDANRVVLNEERIRYWLGQGAQVSDRVARFLDKAGILPGATRHRGTGKRAAEIAAKKAEAEQAA